MQIHRVCDQSVPAMGFWKGKDLDWKRDQSDTDIVGTCNGTRIIQREDHVQLLI
jgi:hypothetical protein